jgi:polyhydroxyalkanoic acid synthase PhaR subunit
LTRKDKEHAVQDGAKFSDYTNPLEAWRKWNAIASRTWTNATDSSKEAEINPFSFYRLWMNAMEPLQERMKTNALPQFDVQAVWKQWLDTTMGIWQQAVHMGGDPLGLIAGWIKVMENMQEQIHTNGTYPLDPFILFREWFNATSEQWSKLVEETISSEQVLQFTGPFLESSSSLINTFRRASEEYFKTLRLPTSSDIASLAELVVNLEEKIDNIEDALDRVEGQGAQRQITQEITAIEHETEAKVAHLEHHLNQVEAKLDRMLEILEKE